MAAAGPPEAGTPESEPITVAVQVYVVPAIVEVGAIFNVTPLQIS